MSAAAPAAVSAASFDPAIQDGDPASPPPGFTPLTQSEIDQRVFDLYDEYCHGRIDRRAFPQHDLVATGALTSVTKVERRTWPRPVHADRERHVRDGLLDGDEIEIEADELMARMFQHELDHLHGVLMFDRMTPEQRKEAMAEYRRLQEQPAAAPRERRRLRLR